MPEYLICDNCHLNDGMFSVTSGMILICPICKHEYYLSFTGPVPPVEITEPLEEN
jgi:hypothetical protein